MVPHSHQLLSRNSTENCAEDSISAVAEAFLYKRTCWQPENMMSGFQKCGLYPVNKEAVPKAKLRPSTTLILSVEQTATVSLISASESSR